ncbi:TWiK family of potassium channels protein 7 [Aphelenchoides besseyi]|nr:TWiK family of potassium channels protein 7 [Aphelenchoides besseyi]
MNTHLNTSAFSRRSRRVPLRASGQQQRKRYRQHLTPDYDPDASDESLPDESDEPLITVRSVADSYAQNNSVDPSINSNQNAYDPTENDVSIVERDSDYDIEQYEMEDRIGEMPPTFTRRQRREGLFTPQTSRSLRPETPWETNELLASNHLQKSLNDEYIASDGRNSDEEVEVSAIRKYAKLILPHVGLVLLTCTYTIIGAAIFFCVENPNEKATKREQLDQIYARQEQFVSTLLRLAAENESSQFVWRQVADQHMHNLSDHLFIAYEKYFLTATEVKRNGTVEIWTFSTAIFFAVTVVTTIGYGNPVPITQTGRVMCIVFSLFGIPLTLVTIADLGKFLSENLIWLYSVYLHSKHYICRRMERRRERHEHEHVCQDCQQHRGLTPHHMQILEENRIPSMVVFAILVLYTALGGALMSRLETWSFFTSFYWSFITMTTVYLMPRRDQYMYLILLYIVLGLAITTMCIDLVDARSALAVVGGKVVLVSELYANLMQKRARNSARDAFIIENLYVSKHIIPFIPSDIRWIRYIDQNDQNSLSNSTSSLDLHSCRFCHSRFSHSRVSISQSQLMSS